MHKMLVCIPSMATLFLVLQHGKLVFHRLRSPPETDHVRVHTIPMPGLGTWMVGWVSIYIAHILYTYGIYYSDTGWLITT